MTPHQQEITVLIAGLCLGLAAVGVVVMLGALAFPATSTTSRRLFASGAVVAVTSCMAYLIYVSTVYLTLSELTP